MLLPLMPRGAGDPGYPGNPAICSPPCRSSSEQPGGDQQRGKSAGQPDGLSAAADEADGDVMRRRAARCQAVGSGKQRPHRRGDRDNDQRGPERQLRQGFQLAECGPGNAGPARGCPGSTGRCRLRCPRRSPVAVGRGSFAVSIGHWRSFPSAPPGAHQPRRKRCQRSGFCDARGAGRTLPGGFGERQRSCPVSSIVAAAMSGP
jgi:hypothetical protein